MLKKIKALEAGIIDLDARIISAITGMLPWSIDKGGTGGITKETARVSLDVYSKAEVNALLPTSDNPLPVSKGGTGAFTPSVAIYNLGGYSRSEVDNRLPSTTNPVTIAKGGTGGTTADGARTNLDVYSKEEVNELIQPGGILDTVYPIGTIYQSTVQDEDTVSGCPIEGTLGGTWAKIEGRFLLAANSTHAAGTTGGTENTTLSVDNIPSHSHRMDGVEIGEPTTSSCRLIMAANGNMTVQHGNTVKWNANSSDPSTPYDRTFILGSAQGSNTAAVGSGASFTNMPPYQTVYMWKRTA